MGFKILAINPGSTSTKVALYDEERPLLDLSLRHSAGELARFPNIIDQLDWRREMILTALSENDFDIMQLSAVIGRGGLVKPIPAGVYEVNDAMKYDLLNPREEHASNLGGLLAADIAAMADVRAYIADPVVVDELDEVARLSGLPECPRRSIFHALNQKATARLHCDRIGIAYEKANLVVAHLGGGISVAAHKQGRVVDVNNALDGDGPFAPERAGTIPTSGLADLCFSGRYTRPQIQKLLAGQGGMVAHLGTNSMIEVRERIAQGDEKAKLVVESMCYNVSKAIGAMAAALSGKVDAVVITGGLAHGKDFVDYVEQHCSFIAPVTVYPGENEIESLVTNALVVLRGVITPKVYL
ncbi:butyrate kinase [uncultured Alistipes sp.]|jgi:butyrate kinase|uniref:butyrate kinase n=1 Tax=uncultured Alistipes sp. TaxID=538949 RepID=UPI0025D528C2|nr:butyrate kinase [uncultured Alistipes sp.]